MSSKYLGETFDLHGGGLDLIFPHHENEIAQSEGASGKTLCNCWMHGGFLDLEGAKMSKSLGNVVRARDALQKVDAEGLRYFFLSTHYRQALNFTDKSLSDAEARMEYFYETLQKLDDRVAAITATGDGALQGAPERFLAQFHEQMSDDFNIPGALGVISGLFTEINTLLEKPPKDKALLRRTLLAYRKVAQQLATALGLFERDPTQWLSERRDRLVVARGIDRAKVEALIKARDDARALKTPDGYKESDRLRAELKTTGIELMDTPGGTRWKVLSSAAP
jgi:cysteinyl-tRNA synthetase